MNNNQFIVTKVDNGFVVTMPIKPVFPKTGLGKPPKFRTTLICKDVTEVNDLLKKFAETEIVNHGSFLASAEPLHDLDENP